MSYEHLHCIYFNYHPMHAAAGNTPYVGWTIWGVLHIMSCVLSVCCVAGAQYVFI